MKEAAGDPPDVSRLIVVFLRYFARMTQAQLGSAAKIHQGYLSLYETGQRVPSEGVLRRIATATRVPWPTVVHLRRFLLSIQSPISGEAWTDHPPDVLGFAVETYLAEEAAETLPSPEEAKWEADRAWSALKNLSAPRRRRAIERSPRTSRNWALVLRLCEESLRSAADRPDEALELARLALLVAERVEGEADWSKRLQAFAWSHIANALRVGNDFPGADAAFTRAWNLWPGAEEAAPQVVPQWRMLSLEASHRREQARFQEALGLLDRAACMVEGDPAVRGRLLLKKEFVFEEMGDLPRALATLEEAAPLVEASEDRRLLCVLRFETAKALCETGRYTEASGLLPIVRKLAAELSNDLDLLRCAWLAARVAAGLGEREEAIAGLEQVRRDFTVRDLPYDAARASLELAVLHLEEGRTLEVKTLAREMTPVFQAQGIARESLAAVSVFLEAAQKETATLELARRALEELKKARRG